MHRLQVVVVPVANAIDLAAKFVVGASDALRLPVFRRQAIAFALLPWPNVVIDFNHAVGDQTPFDLLQALRRNHLGQIARFEANEPIERFQPFVPREVLLVNQVEQVRDRPAPFLRIANKVDGGWLVEIDGVVSRGVPFRAGEALVVGSFFRPRFRSIGQFAAG